MARKLNPQQRCDLASRELREILERYNVMVGVDDQMDPPLIFMTPAEDEDEYEPSVRIH